MSAGAIVKIVISVLSNKKSRTALMIAIIVPIMVVILLVYAVGYVLNPFNWFSRDEVLAFEDDYTTIIAEVKDEKNIQNNLPDYAIRLISFYENADDTSFSTKDLKKYIKNNFVKKGRFLEAGEIINYIVDKKDKITMTDEEFNSLVDNIDFSEQPFLSAVASVPLVYGTSYTVSNNVATLTGNRHGKVISGIPGKVKEVSVNAKKPSKSYVVIESEITPGVMLQLKYENLIYVKVKVSDSVEETDLIGFQGENNVQSDKLKLTITVNGEKRNPTDFLGEEVSEE